MIHVDDLLHYRFVVSLGSYPLWFQAPLFTYFQNHLSDFEFSRVFFWGVNLLTCTSALIYSSESSYTRIFLCLTELPLSMILQGLSLCLLVL